MEFYLSKIEQYILFWLVILDILFVLCSIQMYVLLLHENIWCKKWGRRYNKLIIDTRKCDMRYEAYEYEIWDMRYEIWDMRFEIWDMR